MSEGTWAGRSVPQMWASAQAADTQTAWQQVNAWRRTHDLLLHHAGRLKACADELSYAWPPGKSPAAQAFIEHITQLRTAILQASLDAATNYSAIAGVLSSLSSAKADMAELMQEWESYANAPTAEQARRVSLGDSNSPEGLNARARIRMSQNDQEVLESSRRLVQLSPPGEQPIWTKDPIGGASQSAAQSGNGRSKRTAAMTTRLTPPSVESTGAIDGHPGLAGSTVSPKPVGSSDSLPARVEPSALPGAAPSSISTVGPRGMGSIPLPSAQPEIGRVARVGGSAGHAASGTAPFPPVTGLGRPQAKVNPVGGVIEANRSAVPASAFPLMGGARGGAGDRHVPPAPLTMVWEVPEDVSPVIEPAAEVPFDLGPGVIGIDR
ncbi:hypothetical protein GCM10009557_04630 [Virgisporangium ochraceum]|uniref:PPE family domain-containing protein n=1 Tax=Virgisporangium ochraceum TaxID=65505 RepID=A0A8J4E8N7_9ACTN|nr:hypothetical protein Voc01_003450 [Virgisporangium ochraceum]